MIEGDGVVVLAVEDDLRNAALLRAILLPAGYELHVAVSLAGAREWLADASPDIVLLDRHLPDGDGLGLLRELRAEHRHDAVRVILVTASVLDKDRHDADLAGCDGFLAKPIRIRGLLEEIERQRASAVAVAGAGAV